MRQWIVGKEVVMTPADLKVDQVMAGMQSMRDLRVDLGGRRLLWIAQPAGVFRCTYKQGTLRNET